MKQRGEEGEEKRKGYGLMEEKGGENGKVHRQ